MRGMAWVCRSQKMTNQADGVDINRSAKKGHGTTGAQATGIKSDEVKSNVAKEVLELWMTNRKEGEV